MNSEQRWIIPEGAMAVLAIFLVRWRIGTGLPPFTPLDTFIGLLIIGGVVCGLVCVFTTPLSRFFSISVFLTFVLVVVLSVQYAKVSYQRDQEHRRVEWKRMCDEQTKKIKESSEKQEGWLLRELKEKNGSVSEGRFKTHPDYEKFWKKSSEQAPAN